MATSCALDRLGEWLECSVCLDHFSEPRTLPCLHTFCTKCLEDCPRLLPGIIECPVCRQVSDLPVSGVRGLPIDYRIQQILEFFSDMQAGDRPDPVDSSADLEVAKHCSVCKTQQQVVAASHHCVQCLMQLCGECVERHNTNPVLASHQLIAVSDARTMLATFCTQHCQHQIRYFCADCCVTLCSVCAIGHDPSHRQELVEQVFEKHRIRVPFILSAMSTDRDSTAELEFDISEIQQLIADIRQLLAGPPVLCHLAIDEIVGRVKRFTDSSFPAEWRRRAAVRSRSRRPTAKPITQQRHWR